MDERLPPGVSRTTEMVRAGGGLDSGRRGTAETRALSRNKKTPTHRLRCRGQRCGVWRGICRCHKRPRQRADVAFDASCLCACVCGGRGVHPCVVEGVRESMRERRAHTSHSGQALGRATRGRSKNKFGRQGNKGPNQRHKAASLGTRLVRASPQGPNPQPPSIPSLR